MKAAALGLCTALLAAGCSTAPGPAAAPPAAPVLRLEVRAPEPLAALLGEHLDLARVNRLAGGEPLQPGELDRLLAAAPAQARTLLDTEGYHAARVWLAREPGRMPPVVTLEVDPGPRTVVAEASLVVEGPLHEAATGGAADPATRAHAREAEAALRAAWPLPPGRPFRDDDWTRAKAAALAAARARGYVAARWRHTQADVDAARGTAVLSALLDSGPLYRVGPLRVSGLVVQDEQTVRNIAHLDPGAPASELLLLEVQERLQKSDLFDLTSVTLQPTPEGDPAATPVALRLTERTLQDATFGVGFEANVGPRLTVDHVHRRPFGRPWVARQGLVLSGALRRWEGELSTQMLPRLWRHLVGGAFERLESDTDIVHTQRLRVGRAQATRDTDRLLFAEAQRSTKTSALGRERDEALYGQWRQQWRRLDDPLLPTDGEVWTVEAGSGVARSEPGGRGPFVRGWARLDAFRPLRGGWQWQGRVEAGEVREVREVREVARRDTVRVPEGLRFRAGGDASVRGYGYRELTPVVNGVEVSGNVLFTASTEFQHRLAERWPQLWGALFADAGNAALRWRDLEPAWGLGAGLRYRSPVGPVRLDLAWGRQVHKLRLHLSVGLSF